MLLVAYAGLCAVGGFMRGENWSWQARLAGRHGQPARGVDLRGDAGHAIAAAGAVADREGPAGRLPGVPPRRDGPGQRARARRGRLRLVPRRRRAHARQAARARRDGTDPGQSRDRAAQLRPVAVPPVDHPARRALGDDHDGRRRRGRPDDLRRAAPGWRARRARRARARPLAGRHAPAAVVRDLPSRQSRRPSSARTRRTRAAAAACLSPELRPRGAGGAERLLGAQGRRARADPPSRHPGALARHRQRPVLRLPQPLGAHLDELRRLARDARSAGGGRAIPAGRCRRATACSRTTATSSASCPTSTTSAAWTASTATPPTK